MKSLKIFGIMACLLVGMLALTLQTQADQWNKKTIMTVNETIQIPGATLTPGKYVFKLMDSPANRHIVQVFNEDESQVITTILAIPNQRLRPTGKTEFGFWEMPQDSPPALRSWFYPGDNFGQEFAYPKSEATKIAAAVHQEVPSIAENTTSEQLASAEVNTESDVASNQQNQPAPEPTPAASASTNTETARVEDQVDNTQSRTRTTAVDTSRDTAADQSRSTVSDTPLPDTASGLPLAGLMGFLSIGAGLVVRLLRHHLS